MLSVYLYQYHIRVSYGLHVGFLCNQNDEKVFCNIQFKHAFREYIGCSIPFSMYVDVIVYISLCVALQSSAALSLK